MTVRKKAWPKRRYLIIVEGDVEPSIHGPYPSEFARQRRAQEWRDGDPEKRDGIYALTIETPNTLTKFDLTIGTLALKERDDE